MELQMNFKKFYHDNTNIEERKGRARGREGRKRKKGKKTKEG